MKKRVRIVRMCWRSCRTVGFRKTHRLFLSDLWRFGVKGA